MLLAFCCHGEGERAHPGAGVMSVWVCSLYAERVENLFVHIFNGVPFKVHMSNKTG